MYLYGYMHQTLKQYNCNGLMNESILAQKCEQVVICHNIRSYLIECENKKYITSTSITIGTDNKLRSVALKIKLNL